MLYTTDYYRWWIKVEIVREIGRMLQGRWVDYHLDVDFEKLYVGISALELMALTRKDQLSKWPGEDKKEFAFETLKEEFFSEKEMDKHRRLQRPPDEERFKRITRNWLKRIFNNIFDKSMEWESHKEKDTSYIKRAIDFQSEKICEIEAIFFMLNMVTKELAEHAYNLTKDVYKEVNKIRSSRLVDLFYILLYAEDKDRNEFRKKFFSENIGLMHLIGEYSRYSVADSEAFKSEIKSKIESEKPIINCSKCGCMIVEDEPTDLCYECADLR